MKTYPQLYETNGRILWDPGSYLNPQAHKMGDSINRKNPKQLSKMRMAYPKLMTLEGSSINVLIHVWE